MPMLADVIDCRRRLRLFIAADELPMPHG